MIVAPDHLIVGCATLDAGIEHIERLTGAMPLAGGRHSMMGTHNALIKLGPKLYLELIAIDPDSPAPPRPRWFELDQPAMRAALAERPHLIAWAARTDDLDDALMRATIAPGVATAMTRGDLAWRITVPDDGMRAAGGVLPVLIQWTGDAHPVQRLPESGVTLAQLAASHPSPAMVREALAAWKLADAMTVTHAATPRVAAMLRTPRGLVAI
ncbi:MAG TPA: VOC family protein [Casimicrobiaceae bacterium]|jgi:hypothetical protein